jgi:ribosomal protein S27E
MGSHVMIPCPECGHENKDSAIQCASCRKSLQPAGGHTEFEDKAADELERMLEQLDLRETAGATAAGGAREWHAAGA